MFITKDAAHRLGYYSRASELKQLWIDLGETIGPGGFIVDLGCHVAKGVRGYAFYKAFSASTNVKFCSTEFYQIVGYYLFIDRYTVFYPDGGTEERVDHEGFFNLQFKDRVIWSGAVIWDPPPDIN